MRMLVPAPYQVPVKKDKKKNKEAESGLHHEGTSDAMSGGSEAPSSHEGDENEDEEEEEEGNPPLKWKKRVASADPEARAPKRGKLSLSDDSDSDAEDIPKPRPRIKPLAESPARDLPRQSSSSGDLPPEKIESETPPQAAEVSELKQKLKLADEDIVLINKRLNEAQDGAAEVETLTDLKAEQATQHQFEEQISAVEQELKDAARKCESLEKENRANAAELAKALQEAKDAWSKSRLAREEIRQAGQIAAGKPFLLQTKFGDQRYALLNRLWSSLDAFADLPKSAADAAQFFQAQERHATEKPFWSQFAA
nr:uncharacterized protein DDB_G0286299-like [Aegilops tauschii subsp. strangulata]